MDEPSQPTIDILAGPNGAGKTTFANSFLPGFANCLEFLNADLIAAGFAPFAPETQAVRASELLLRRIDEPVAARTTFSFETTLAARSYQASILEPPIPIAEIEDERELVLDYNGWERVQLHRKDAPND